MQTNDLEQLASDIRNALAERPDGLFAILGRTPVTYDVLRLFSSYASLHRVLGIYAVDHAEQKPGGDTVPLKPLSSLKVDQPNFLVVAADAEKEELLKKAAPHLSPRTRVLLAGYSHFAFRDPVFSEIVAEALVPSLANGYPHTLVHLYECLKNAARRDLSGVVVEFGMFKGGTTFLLSRFIEALHRDWLVIGFDTFAGFPPKRSVLDMYEHPGCVFHDEASVRDHLASRNIEIVSGDIVQTVVRLETENILLAFVDTDNYTPASAVLDVIQTRVVPGGAIVFDHFTGRDRFRYTLGERMAAERLLDDPKYFHLHDTGVFFRQY